MSSRRKFISKIAAAGGAVFILLKSDSLARVTEAVANLNATDLPNKTAGNESFWGRIQSSFDVDRTIVNLNNGGVSPSPRLVHDALKRHLDYSNQAPSYFMWRHLEPNIESVREQIALRFGCQVEEIAITRNASEALENIQLGFELKAGDEIITTTQDYPRMLTTWEQRARREGVIIKKISYPVPLMSKHDFIERIEEAITPRTKLILLCHVVFLTGQILPLKEVSEIAHAKGIQVICDGAHSFYHFPFTLKDLDCDYFGTSLHKWTFAPVGTGFLYVRKNLISKIWPLMAAPAEMDSNIRKFEEIGTHPAANHNAIAEALTFNETIGLERKAERLRYLNKRWINRLKNFNNVKFMTNINDDSQWCGIINVHIEGTDVDKVVTYLLDKHRIFVTPIKHEEFEGMRITPNVYTLLSDIDLFADVMERIAGGYVKEVMK